ncbi:UNVERIFIED_CONTAM: hypothetical protein GTU68_060876 [Idotea baltica]|nr:hypothetical protein [Idotea baltica]
MNGTITEWFHLLRIKVPVDLAGLSPLLELWNLTGIFSERART